MAEDLALRNKEIEKSRAESDFQAKHDELTGLPNRRYFLDYLEQVLGIAGPVKAHKAVLFVDLDDFKEVNDSYGHSVGDYLLNAVGERLCNCVRSDDTVARLGGDEFAVVLHGDGDGATPEAVRQRISDAMRAPFEIDGTLLALGASVGIGTPLPEDVDVTADLLLHRADSAMYVAKRRTKGDAGERSPGEPGVAVASP